MTPSRRITTTSLIGMCLPIQASSHPCQRQVHGRLGLRSLDHSAGGIWDLVAVDVHILELLVGAERIEEPYQVDELTTGSRNHQGTRQDRDVRLSHGVCLGKGLREVIQYLFRIDLQLHGRDDVGFHQQRTLCKCSVEVEQFLLAVESSNLPVEVSQMRCRLYDGPPGITI